MAPPAPMTWDEMKALEGSRVRVILDWLIPEAFCEGTLLHLSEEGEVTYLKTDGSIAAAWPALDMELLPQVEPG